MATTPDPEPDLDLDPARRAALARRLRTALEAAADGSRTASLGSLAAGTADAYSDIDLRWTVPDAAFPAAVAGAREALAAAQPVEAVRTDPDFGRSDRRRLLFVHFSGVPLFWRLDLDIRAASAADVDGYDEANPAARGGGPWSAAASALANGVGTVKAVRRGRTDEARGLLDRGLARVGAGPSDPSAGWAESIARLAAAAAAAEPGADLAERAARVTALARALLPVD